MEGVAISSGLMRCPFYPHFARPKSFRPNFHGFLGTSARLGTADIIAVALFFSALVRGWHCHLQVFFNHLFFLVPAAVQIPQVALPRAAYGAWLQTGRWQVTVPCQ